MGALRVGAGWRRLGLTWPRPWESDGWATGAAMDQTCRHRGGVGSPGVRGERSVGTNSRKSPVVAVAADATRPMPPKGVVGSVSSVESFQNFFVANLPGLSARAALRAASGIPPERTVKKTSRRESLRAYPRGFLLMHQIAESYLCAFPIRCLASPRESWQFWLSLFLPYTKGIFRKMFDASS